MIQNAYLSFCLVYSTIEAESLQKVNKYHIKLGFWAATGFKKKIRGKGKLNLLVRSYILRKLNGLFNQIKKYINFNCQIVTYEVLLLHVEQSAVKFPELKSNFWHCCAIITFNSVNLKFR